MAPATTEPRPHWGRRLLWFALIYGASVIAVGVVATVLRLILKS